jgi:hypothetical protein
MEGEIAMRKKVAVSALALGLLLSGGCSQGNQYQLATDQRGYYVLNTRTGIVRCWGQGQVFSLDFNNPTAVSVADCPPTPMPRTEPDSK